MIRRCAHHAVRAAIVLCVLAVVGCGTSSDTGRRYSIHLQRGIEAYERGDYGRALNAFRKALQFNPDDPKLYLYIAELYDDYLKDKLKAIDYYNRFLERSKDEQLNEWVKEWIAQAEADLAGETPGSELVTTEDPGQKVRELQAKLAQALMVVDKYRAQVGEPKSTPSTKARAPLVPWLVAGLCGGVAVAVLVLAYMGWLGAGGRVALRRRPKEPALDEQLVVGRYFWVENEFNLGTVSIDRENGRLRVESTSLSTNARSVGYGRLDKDTLKAELTDESGLKAPTVFRFAPDGMSFTAEWTDDLGPGVAIGVRER